MQPLGRMDAMAQTRTVIEGWGVGKTFGGGSVIALEGASDADALAEDEAA